MTSPARTSAFRALLTYRKTGQVSGLQCRQSVDRHLAERIVYGVLQNERYLDFCLAQFITRGFRRLHPAALDLLRLSAYQILFLDRIPESAIVNDAVSICRDGSYSHLAGFVNAVLRRLSENKEHVLSLSAPLSVRYSHPDWMVSRLIDRFGREFTGAILNADQSIPLLCIQVNTDRCTLEDFTALLRQNDIEVLSVNRELSSVQVNSSEVEKLPGYRDGLFYIQDDAAKYSVHLADMIPGTSVLDVCAAPGGKSIAAKLEGGNPISCDISSERIRRCVENYSRLGMDIPVRIQDAGEFQPEFEAHFSLVIADVPCSGTGVIRKHPEIRYKTESEFQNLLEIQRSILDNVSRYVAPGGLLLYSTCSVMQEENEDQVEGFLCLHPEYRLIAVNQENDPCQNGMYHSWPHLTGNDGFFAAKLRRCDD